MQDRRVLGLRALGAAAIVTIVLAGARAPLGKRAHAHDHSHDGHSHAHEGKHHHHSHDVVHAHDHSGHSHDGHDHHSHHGHSHPHHADDHAGHSHPPSASSSSLHTPLSASEKHPLTAIALTTLSGGAAVFGGLLVVSGGAPSPRVLGHLLSFAAGIMLYISYADLLPHAVSSLGEAVAGTGAHAGHSHGAPGASWTANSWMFGGMALFAAIALAFPDGDDEEGGGAAYEACHRK